MVRRVFFPTITDDFESRFLIRVETLNRQVGEVHPYSCPLGVEVDRALILLLASRCWGSLNWIQTVG